MRKEKQGYEILVVLKLHGALRKPDPLSRYVSDNLLMDSATTYSLSPSVDLALQSLVGK